MRSVRVVVKAVAALLFIFLLLSPSVLWAEGISNASLISVETLDSGQKRISVRIGFRIERLLVTPNKNLNNLNIVDNQGVALEQTGTAYEGIVESLPNSWARIVIDGDYIAGAINTHGNSTHFTSESTTHLTRRSVLAEPLIPPPEAPKSANPNSNNGAPRRFAQSELAGEISVPVNARLTETIGDVVQVIRIGIVVDTLYQEALGGRGLSNAIATINTVDGLYREKFGLALKVDVVVLVTDNDFLALDDTAQINPDGPSLKDHLDLFREYRINSELLPGDLGLVHLFSGVQSEDMAIGLAFRGAACRTDGHDVSMSRPFLFRDLLAAHEIGHNLGADHDDITQCRNMETNLMFSAISSTTTREFSSCSAEAIETRIQQSTCLTGVIDIDLQVTQLESNQIQLSVSNLDETRAFPSATLSIDLVNAAIAEAPAMCDLEEPTKLTCLVPATFAGDTQDIAIKLRLEPGLERTAIMRLEPNGFFDLNDSNNAAELIIPGDPLPLASTEGEVIVQSDLVSASSGASSGGGTIGLPLVLWVLLLSGINRQRRTELSA